MATKRTPARRRATPRHQAAPAVGIFLPVETEQARAFLDQANPLPVIQA